jgi:leucyl-tRNA synthetase
MTAGWPAFDPAKLVASTITIVVQVNGKHRGEITAPPDTPEAELTHLACTNPKVAPHLAGKPIKRTILVKGRLINLLV